MRIDFGLHADGLQPKLPETAQGAVTLGPSGLLGVLETQLGLTPSTGHPSEGALTYLQCLREATSPKRFFHESLQVDPVNVAGTLLDWREQWYEAGWDGTFPEDVPGRLTDMAAIEKRAKGRVPPGPGERLQQVAQALSVRKTQIERVNFQTPLDDFSEAWKQVLAVLPCESSPGLDLAPAAPAESDLAIVQATLLAAADANGESIARRTALRGDGSLVVLKAISRDLSADAVAELLLADGDGAGTLLVAERDGIVLDNALERAGLPRCGFRYHTAFRGATQVLKLSLALIWAPVDPHRTLQFLLHPTGPLPQWVRSRLADALAASPGIGGPAWNEALDGIAQTQRDRFEGKETEIEELLADVDYWLNGERYDPGEGALLEALVRRTQRVSSWASTRLNTVGSSAEATLFGAAHAQAEALLAGLAQLGSAGEACIPRLQLERLVDEVTSEIPDPSSFSEAGHTRATASPATVTERWQTVIWWNLAPPSATASYPWSPLELASLQANGVKLPSIDDRLQASSRDWLRPVCQASERLVLAMHDDERGMHPIWTQIASHFDGLESIEVDSTLLQGQPNLAPLAVQTRPLPLCPLPAPRRWWNLPDDCPVARRDVESYSSISKVCDYPHEWVLQYAARLRPGRAADLSDGALLYGTLGHRVIEEFFQAHDGWRKVRDRDAVSWVRTTWPNILEREGAVLLEPGRGVDRQRVGAIVERALVQLLAHLRAAHIEQVAPEASVEVKFAKRLLTGTIDLLTTDAKKRRAVVDVKWSSQNFRRGLLEDNRALQLGTYAYLQRTHDRSSAWPPGAFFILSTGNLLTADSSRFPGAIVSDSRSGEGVAELWSRLGVTCDWRWKQLEAGKVEVVSELTEPDGDSAPPETGLAPVSGADPFDDFTSLTGWEVAG